MNKVMFIFLAVNLAFTMALAQPSISISGSGGYYRAVVDGMDDYPFTGPEFGAGISGLIPMTDIAQFGIGASIGYYSVSASDEDDVELTLSSFSLYLTPKLRVGQEKTYVDISLPILIPLSTKMTMKVPGHGSASEDVKDTETDFAVELYGRYNFIGVGIGKVLTGSNGATMFGASAFIPISEQLEIGPSISYATGKDGSNLNISFGAEYTF